MEAEGHIPRMNHVNTVLQGDSNDVVLGEVGANRRQALPDTISLIRLD